MLVYILAVDKIAAMLKSKILSDVSFRFIEKLRHMQTVNFYAIPIRGAVKCVVSK
jgi:hypothetical protein